MTSRLVALALIAALATAAGCDSGSLAPAPAPAPVAPAPAGVQPLSAATQQRAATAMKKAKAFADQAYVHLDKGKQVEQAESFNAAIPHYQEAKPLLKKALQEIEYFIEPDLEVVTAEQIRAFCGEYTRATRKWQQAIAGMGKVPPK